jgi:hypothetical protein
MLAHQSGLVFRAFSGSGRPTPSERGCVQQTSRSEFDEEHVGGVNERFVTNGRARLLTTGVQLFRGVMMFPLYL